MKALYEQIGPDDEPPFPADGLAPIYKAVSAAQQKLQATGSLTMAVQVSPHGEATSVEVLRSPDRRMVQFVAAVLMLQKYKPALCSGNPARCSARSGWSSGGHPSGCRRREVNSTTPADVATLRSAGLDDRAIFEATAFVAFRLAFSTVHDALGANPDWQLVDAAPPEVRSAVTYGRPPTAPSAETRPR